MADIAAMFSRWASSGLSSLLGRSRAPISTSSSTEEAPHGAVADMQRVMGLLPKIKAVLLDAEKREMRDESVKLWLTELKNLAYDADDIIDEYDYEILKATVEAGDDDGEKEEDVLKVPISVSMANKLMEIGEKFEEIARDREALRLREEDGVMIRPFDPSMWPPPTSSHVDELSIRGRGEEKKKLIEQLISSDKKDNKGSVVVIPIVGMGGIGKTTLAQLIYNDSRICEHFNFRGWVCVSESFDVVRIMKELFESITKKSCENNNKTSLDCLHSSLKEELAGKRTLIVLDDVWNEDRSLWDSFSSQLHGFGAAIKIIITTRNKGVADVARTTPSFHLDLLSEEESWLLFKQCAGFDYREDPDGAAGDQFTLVKIGKMIVNKCRNLPLAVKLMGSYLRFEKDVERWNEILESDMWELDGEEKLGILPALRLSYERMPTYLKPCFKYCSLFSKDHEFDKSHLIRLWIAQGYILPKRSKSLEEIGGEYVAELVRRSFFIKQQLWRSSRFVMHDLVVDLGRSTAGEEFAVVKLENGKSTYNNIPNSVRHLAVHCDSNQKAEVNVFINSLLNRHAALRSLFYHGNRLGKVQFTKFMRLRTLEFICKDGFSNISESIGYLKHLRYLRFEGEKSFSCVSFSGVCLINTYNLQTLDLFDNETVESPGDICKLINLRHLLLPEDSFLPRGIRKLTKLRTLKSVIVKNSCDLQCGGIGQLKDLENLQGSCLLYGLQNVVDLTDPKEANLISKGNIRKLRLDWHTNRTHDDWDIIIEQVDPAFGDDSDIISQPDPASDDDSDIIITQPDPAPDDDSDIIITQPDPASEHDSCFSTISIPAESVLETLQPHSNINKLEIIEYPGSRFPVWISFPSFSRLTDILFDRCSNCEILPPLGQLPSLRRLRVVSLDRLQRVGREFVCDSLFENATVKNMDASVKGFPSLEELEFKDMSGWVEWLGVLNGDFPCLVHLKIVRCKNLKRIDKIPSSSLKTLEILGCPLLTSLPTVTSKLSDLSVSYCDKLTSIPGLQSCNSLKYLQLQHCRSLQLSPDHQLPSMPKEVSIGYCPGLEDWYQSHQVNYNTDQNKNAHKT